MVIAHGGGSIEEYAEKQYSALKSRGSWDTLSTPLPSLLLFCSVSVSGWTGIWLERRETGPDWATPQRLHSPHSLQNDSGQWFFKYPVRLKETWIPLIKSCSKRRKFILSSKDKNALLSDLIILLSGFFFFFNEVSS